MRNTREQDHTGISRILLKLVGCSCLGLIVVSASLGFQSKRSSTRQQPEKATSTSSGWDSTFPFDATVRQLKPGYLGHDIMDLYHRLEKLDLKKDQFETTDQHRKRMRSLAGSDLYAFWVVWADDAFRYDADRQVISVSIPIEHTWMFDTSAPAVLINLDTKYSHYTGTTKIGTGKSSKKTVNKESQEYYYVVIHTTSYGYLTLKFPMSPARAKSVIRNLSVLFLCRLNFDDANLIYTQAEQVRYPTVKNPWDVTRFKKYINASLDSILIFDGSSGEIQAKLPSP
jgi:hypothetical protein